MEYSERERGGGSRRMEGRGERAPGKGGIRVDPTKFGSKSTPLVMDQDLSLKKHCRIHCACLIADTD